METKKDGREEALTDSKQLSKKAEELLEVMKNETLYMIQSAKEPSIKSAWYYSHLGSLDFARQIGFISEERRQALYREFNTALKSNNEAMISK